MRHAKASTFSGYQINVDLPWNPSRLEQRKGRVQRIGQVRDDVHILSLRYAGTVEDQVYATLSARFGDIFSVLGQLPDGFEDQWIDAILRDREAVKNFSQRVEKERPPIELRYMRDVADDHGLDWEYTEKVLSSRDLDEWMRQGWTRMRRGSCNGDDSIPETHRDRAAPKKDVDGRDKPGHDVERRCETTGMCRSGSGLERQSRRVETGPKGVRSDRTGKTCVPPPGSGIAR
jgi:hypothetical protein